MKIIEEYKNLTEEIAVIKSRIKTAKRKLDKNINIYKPSELKGIAYDQVKTQTTMRQQSIFITGNNILNLQEFIKESKKELKELEEQRKELENTINELGDVKKQVMFLLIKGYTQQRIADELHYSKRWIEKICVKIKKEFGESST